MELVVAQAVRRVGESFPFELEETLAQQQYDRRTVGFSEPLHIRGQYSFDGKAYTVTAEAETVLSSVCARCGKTFAEPFTFSFTERFVREGTEDEETYPYTGDRLDLSRAVMDNLFLQLPIVSVCRPDCKGLCPVCGNDLNERACACSTEKKTSPFAALLPQIEENKEV